jgi:hypothetical protein
LKQTVILTAMSNYFPWPMPNGNPEWFEIMISVDADFRSGCRLESECWSDSIIYVTCAHVNEFWDSHF